MSKGCIQGSVCVQECVCPGVCGSSGVCQGVCVQRLCTYPLDPEVDTSQAVDRMTDRCL